MYIIDGCEDDLCVITLKQLILNLNKNDQKRLFRPPTKRSFKIIINSPFMDIV